MDAATEYQQISQAAKVQQRTGLDQFVFQIRLLLWKRYRESTKSRWDLFRLITTPLLFLLLMTLLYVAPGIGKLLSPGALEPFLIPLGFWMYTQRLVVHILHEKSSRMQESMRMMGLSNSTYWLSYFIYDGILIGSIISFLIAVFSAICGLFNEAGFGEVFGLILVYCLSVTPFAFTITAFFDTPQSGGQATLAILLGFFVLYIVVFVAGQASDYSSAQVLCAFFPPLALQMGSGGFLNSYGKKFETQPVSNLCVIMYCDIFIFGFLGWYFDQVLPSEFGVRKPWNFIFDRNYWFDGESGARPVKISPKAKKSKLQRANSDSNIESSGVALAVLERKKLLNSTISITPSILEEMEAGTSSPFEKVDETVTGPPSIIVNHLCKTFGTQKAVNHLSLKMYEDQIFALLGHNGAGKTTSISILTGLITPDPVSSATTFQSDAIIYGNSIRTDMESIRYLLGVCPQHDVLFDTLSIEETILFFSQLKGFSLADAQKECDALTRMFHLQKRKQHLGRELSGGQRRKVSVAIAVCGGSKFVILDEPTAGMDPLARRELWDLLSALRRGRTMLLTTHYMDEADVLGDRVGIMTAGHLQCCGSTHFLKTHYGTGYKLVFDPIVSKAEDGTVVSVSDVKIEELTSFVRSFIPTAQLQQEENDVTNTDKQHTHVTFTLPFSSLSQFGVFFSALDMENQLSIFGASTYHLSVISLEDVFLAVGADHTVKPSESLIKSGVKQQLKLGQQHFSPTLLSQATGIAYRRLRYASNDFTMVPLLGVPIAAIITGAILYHLDLVSSNGWVNDLVIIAIYVGGYLGAPGLIAEFVVRERHDQQLRNVLTVMGCTPLAYWLGSFVADYILLMIPTGIMWLVWFAASMDDFYTRKFGLAFVISLFYNAYLITFSYLFSFYFKSAKACIAFMPLVGILLLILPSIFILIVLMIASAAGAHIKGGFIGGIVLWGIMLLSPNGAMFCAYLDVVNNFSNILDAFPPVYATIIFMIAQSLCYFYYVVYRDTQQSAPVVLSKQTDKPVDIATAIANPLWSSRQQSNDVEAVPKKKVALKDALEPDVYAERQRARKEGPTDPLFINSLRKSYFPTGEDGKARPPVHAVKNVTFSVAKSEIFGLLGANGAGKTTTLSMLTRSILPTAGDAYITQHSILREFLLGAQHLGVVTQSNSLWDRLNVEDHLYLFARLRGVPEDLVRGLVDSTIDQLELTPHRRKLAMRLSGGMKRKLCVAIALIGDPAVVLLDEPSAGLDPVSRRNLWSVIQRTMSQRSVILTTHSMDEAEALCRRIAIMVQGQLRCIGSVQHLTSSTADAEGRTEAAFELTAKLRVASSTTSTGVSQTDTKRTNKARKNRSKKTAAEEADRELAIVQAKAKLTEFVQSLSPTAKLLADNGNCLMTYRLVRSNEVNFGRVFTAIEAQKASLQIEDYTLAHPTLEQVFLRTVRRFTPPDEMNED